MNNPAPFRLTDKMIARGHISDEEMTAFSGVAVQSIYTDELPHSEPLRRNKALSEAEGQTRAAALFDAMAAGGALTFRDEGALASYAHAHAQTMDIFLSLFWNAEEQPQTTAPDIETLFFQKAASPSQVLDPAWGHAPFPETQRFTPVHNDLWAGPVKNFNKVILFRQKRPWSEEFFCKKYLRQPTIKIKAIPDLKKFALAAECHETGHLSQPAPGNHADGCVRQAWTWLREVHAELFCREALKQKEGLRGTLQTRRQSRYFQLLSCADIHTTAPSLDSIGQDKTPPKKTAVLAAIHEIRSQIACLLVKENTALTKREWQGLHARKLCPWTREAMLGSKIVIDQVATYQERWGERFFNHGEEFITALDWAAGHGVFASPLTQRIAERILEAAEFFNPAFTKAHIDLPRRSFPAAKIEAATAGAAP